MPSGSPWCPRRAGSPCRPSGRHRASAASCARSPGRRGCVSQPRRRSAPARHRTCRPSPADRSHRSPGPRCASGSRGRGASEAFEEARVCDVTDRVPVREGLEGEFQADGGSRPTQLIQGRPWTSPRSMRPNWLCDIPAAVAATRWLRPAASRARWISRATIATSSLASVAPRCDLRPAIDESVSSTPYPTLTWPWPSRTAAQSTLRGGLRPRRPSAEPPVGSIRARTAASGAFRAARRLSGSGGSPVEPPRGSGEGRRLAGWSGSAAMDGRDHQARRASPGGSSSAWSAAATLRPMRTRTTPGRPGEGPRARRAARRPASSRSPSSPTSTCCRSTTGR